MTYDRRMPYAEVRSCADGAGRAQTAADLRGTLGSPSSRSDRRRLLRLRLPSEQPVHLCPAARLCAIRHAELSINVREVELDGLLRHPQHPSELGVCEAVGDQPQRLEFAGCELVELRVGFDRRTSAAGEVPKGELHREEH